MEYKKYATLLIVLFVLIMFVGCGNSQGEPTDIKKEEPTQAELDAELRKEAVRADFVELNSEGEDAEIGKKVFAEGVIDVVMSEGVGGEFSLSTKEGEGYGIYTVVNISSNKIREGDTVKIWGVFDGKDEEIGRASCRERV